MANEKLKIGDRVVVKSCVYGHEFTIGEIVTVIEIEDDNSHKCVNSKGETWHLEPGELGTYLEAAAPAMYALLAKFEDRFRKQVETYSSDCKIADDEAEEALLILAAARGEEQTTTNVPNLH
jgi:hypothetical protein